MHKGIFITGTDTGVGKTYVSVGLITALKKTGYAVIPMKPVETGCRIINGKLIPQDSLKLLRSAHTNEPLDLVNPYRFREPLAPAVAAKNEGVVINRKKLLSSFVTLSNRYDITIVEGAGGVMVPIYGKYLFLDLIKDLSIPIVIVSRPGLGTINHTLLTIEAARNRGIDIIGVIINYSKKLEADGSVKTNPGVIEKITGIPVLGTVSYAKDAHPGVFKNIARRITAKF